MKNIDFTQAWNNSDQILVVETKELHVHRCILNMWSSYFDRMFNSNFKEKSSEKVVLEDKNYNEILEMINIIYDRTHPITDYNFEYLLALADEYQIDELRDMCIQFIKNTRKSDSNILNYIAVIQRYKLNSIASCCDNFIEKTTQNTLTENFYYENLETTIKLYIVEKRLKHVEDQIIKYKKSSESLVNYLYRTSNEAYMKYLLERDLDENIFAKCENDDQHKSTKMGQYFDVNCLKCCKRAKHVKEFTVNTDDIIEQMSQLKLLTRN